MMRELVIPAVPPQCTDADICAALSPYGVVHSVTMYPNPVLGQPASALVTMRASEADFVASRGNIRFSNGQECAVELQGGAESAINHHGAAPTSVGGGAADRRAHPPVRVYFYVEDCVHLINESVLRQAFSVASPPSTIRCTPGPGSVCQGWAEFPDFRTAQAVVSRLHGRQIYPNSCRMILKLGGDPRGLPHRGGMDLQGEGDGLRRRRGGYEDMMNAIESGGGWGRGVGGFLPSAPPPYERDALSPGWASRGRGFSPRIMGGAGGGPQLGRGGPAPLMSYQNLPQKMSLGPQAHPFSSPVFRDESPVLIISNVPEHVPLQSLWILMEVYGNVVSLKRQFSHRTNVVAVLQHFDELRSMMYQLSDCPFFGSVLSLKHFAGYVEMSSKAEWNTGPPTSPETLAYDFSAAHHRTRPSTAGSLQRGCRPQPYLFVANLLDSIPDEAVRRLFSDRGHAVRDCERRSASNAIVALESVAEAVIALTETHATKLNDRFLRVSFSPFAPHSAPVAHAPVRNEEQANGENKTENAADASKKNSAEAATDKSGTAENAASTTAATTAPSS